MVFLSACLYLAKNKTLPQAIKNNFFAHPCKSGNSKILQRGPFLQKFIFQVLNVRQLNNFGFNFLCLSGRCWILIFLSFVSREFFFLFLKLWLERNRLNVKKVNFFAIAENFEIKLKTFLFFWSSSFFLMLNFSRNTAFNSHLMP